MANDLQTESPGSAAHDAVATLRGIRRDYDDGRVRALDGIDLQIRPVETIAVVGRSGSGKSTLLNILAGLERPSAGSVAFGSDDRGPANRGAWSRIRARRIGIVFQAFHLLPTLTALQNVMMPMLGIVPSAADRRARAETLLHRVGLAERLAHRPPHLSGGERQRVAIARALANAPRLILADEPTGNLDSDTAARVLDLLFDVASEIRAAMVLVSHDPDIAERAARSVTLQDGRIVHDTAVAPAAATQAARS